MTRPLAFVLLVAGLIAAAETTEQIADRVVAACREGKTDLLRTLADQQTADPWLVAEELCSRGEHEAAAALAAAADRVWAARLPAYVARWRARGGSPPPPSLIARLNELNSADRFQDALDLIPADDGQPLADVSSIRLCQCRGIALVKLGRTEEGLRHYVRAAEAAESLGWSRRVLQLLSEVKKVVGVGAPHAESDRLQMRTYASLLAHLRPLAESERRAFFDRVASSTWSTATMVMAAHQSGDTAAITGLVSRANPDPWRVADRLLLLGEKGAATAFARAAGHADTRGLLAYVETQHYGEGEPVARAALGRAEDAVEAGKFAEALALVEGVAGEGLSPVGRILRGRVAGDAAEGLSRHADAYRAYLATAELAREIGWLSPAGPDFIRAGHAAAKTGNQAIYACWEAALAIEERRGDEERIARDCFLLATILEVRREYERVSTLCERASRIAEGRRDVKRVVSCGVLWGRARNCLEDRAGAFEVLHRALRLAEEHTMAAETAQCLAQLGVVHATIGEFPPAISFLERAIAIEQGLGESKRLADAVANLGTTRSKQGRHREAAALYERAVGLMQKHGSAGDLAETLSNLAVSALDCGDSERAVSCHRRAIEIAEGPGHERILPRILGNAAGAQAALGDFEAALALRLRALAAARSEWCGPSDVVEALIGLTRHWEKRGSLAQALDYADAAIAACGEAGNLRPRAEALGILGGLCLTAGLLPRALETFRQMHEAATRAGNRARALEARAAIAGTQHLLGEHADARESLTQALAEARALGDAHETSRCLARLAIVEKRLRELDAARMHAHEGLRLAADCGDATQAAHARYVLAHIDLAAGRAGEALSGFLQYSAHADARSDVESQIFALAGVASAELELGDLKATIEVCRRGIRLMSGLSTGLSVHGAAGLRDQVATLFIEGVEAAARLDSAAEFLFFVESARAATLLDALRAGDALRTGSLPPELLREEAVTRAAEAQARRDHAAAVEAGQRDAIRETKARLDAASSRIEALIDRIQRTQRRVAAVVYPEPEGLEPIQARLRPDEPLVVYTVGKGRARALVVEPKSARLVDLGPKDEVNDAIDRADAEALRKLLVRPLALADSTRRVLIAPPGWISLMPFALLFDKLEVVFVPSATVLGSLQDEEGAPGEGVLALGDPDYGSTAPSGELELLRSGVHPHPLPASRGEAVAVGDVLLLGKDATESALTRALASRPRWHSVHLACHGIIDFDRPALSSLALAGGDLLSTLDVFRLRVPADLVVLSACETARGGSFFAVGQVGFVQAFLSAGASRVIVSTTKVDDAATGALMTKFYQLWNPKDGSKGLPAATALKRAQEFVASHERWRAPDYWAVWQLWGLPD